MSDKPENEPFSIQSAQDGLEDLFKALPKSKQADYLGHWNEIAVVLQTCQEKLGDDGLKDVTKSTEERREEQLKALVADSIRFGFRESEITVTRSAEDDGNTAVGLSEFINYPEGHPKR